MIREVFNKLSLTLIVLVGLSGCLSSTSSTDKLSQIGAQSCLSAVPIAFDGVMVTIDIPDEVVKFMIKRDGVPILETTDRSVTTKIDTGLIKGQTYRYTCAAILDVNDGYKDLGQELSVTLTSETAPNFGGIIDAYPEGANSIRIEWGLTSGEVISHYKIYKYVGIATDKSQFSNAPIATIYDLALTNYLAEGLGDQIDYSFRVVACNTSNICDDNNAIESAVLADTGVPLTTGLSGIGIVNGEVRVTAPWDDTKGLVSKRTVYRYETGTGVACPTDIGLYSVSDINVAAPRNTPISFNAPGSINQGTRYCYLLRDTDSLNQQELNTAFRFIDVGDLTPPAFNTSLTLERDISFPENRLIANWLSIENESQNPLAGASEYVIFLSSAVPPAQPDADPCNNGTQYGAPTSAASFPQGMNIQVPISGLNPRNNYRICVRAKDSSGNFATNEPKALRSTGDVTAPLFNGVDNASFNGATAQIDVQFVVPNDLDVGNYIIKISRNRSGTVTQIGDIPIIIGVQQPGSTYVYSLTQAQASAQSDDILTIKVDACDDASPTYSTSDNCTLTNVSRTVVIPDSEPPAGFQLVNYTVLPGSTEGSVSVNWNAPPSWDDYAGFKLHYVENGNLIGLESNDCVCTGLDCQTNPKTSCEVSRTDGSQNLDSSRQYEFYLSAYDTDGFSTEQYIDFTGGNKKTVFGRTRDRAQPSFNADFTSEVNNGVVINFDKATDNQYVGLPGNHEITYQIYRKTGSTFSFPCVSGDSKDPECDGSSSLIHTNIESGFSLNGAKLSYTDTNINDGVTYFYQVCAHDFAYTDPNNPFNADKSSNRRCQTGSVVEVAVTDTTPPVALNPSSSKNVAATSWTMSFDVSDNSPVNQLNIKIYRSTTNFPDQGNPGVPIYTTPSQVVIDSNNGTATFNETGTGGSFEVGAEYYYLAEVSDIANNTIFITFRDMDPAPIITGIQMIDGPENGEFPPDIDAPTTAKAQRFLVTGENLNQVTLRLRRSGGTWGQDVNNQCNIESGASTPPTSIVCELQNDGIEFRNDYRLMALANNGQRGITDIGDIIFRRYCEIYTDRASPSGSGSSISPYGLCFPEHFNLIGDSGINGFFRVMQDMDFANDSLPGFVFKGISGSSPNDYKINGNNLTLSNVVINGTTASNGDVGFFHTLGGSATNPVPVLEDLSFINPVVNTDAPSNYIGFLVGGISASGSVSQFFQNISVNGLIINVNHTSVAVGGLVGRVIRSAGMNTTFDSSTFSLSANININISENVSSAVGGLIGTFTARNGDNLIDNLTAENININFSGNGDTNATGIVVGNFSLTSNSPLGNWDLTNNRVINSKVTSSSNSLTNVGGLLGTLSSHGTSTCDVECLVSNNEIDFEFDATSTSTSGGSNYGGLSGFFALGEETKVSQNRIIFEYTGGGNTGNVGGLAGFIGGKRYSGNSATQTSWVAENSVSITAVNVNQGLGGIAGQFEPGYTAQNIEINVENNKIEALNLFSASEELAGIFGRCRYNNNTNYVVNFNKNLIRTSYNGLDPEFDPIANSSNNTYFCETGNGNTYNYTYNYYDSDLANSATSYYEGLNQVEGKTTVELQGAPSSTLYNTWDFTNVWLDRSGNGLPPILRWE